MSLFCWAARLTAYYKGITMTLLSIPPNFIGAEAAQLTNTKSLSLTSSADTLTRTQGTGSSRRKMTFSFWLRTASSHSSDEIHISYVNLDADYINILDSNPDWTLGLYLGYGADGNAFFTLGSGTSTWYHIVLQIDTANATSTSRARCWVNNSEKTITEAMAITQNYDTGWGLNTNTETGPTNHYSTGTWLIDEFSKIDNQLLTPSSFATSNLPKDISGLTFGNQGYWLRFETSTGTSAGVDSSGNGLNFTSAYDDADMSSTVPS